MDHLARLLGDRVSQTLVAMAERTDPDTGKQVEILAPLDVEHAHTLPAHQHDRRAVVGLDDVFRLEIADALHLRNLSSELSACRRRSLSNSCAFSGSGGAPVACQHCEPGTVVPVGDEYLARAGLDPAPARAPPGNHAGGSA